VARAVAGGAILGAASFLGIWATTSELKPLIIAFGTPFLGTLVTRGVAEGWIDTAKKS
jgi:hypothetical protein